MSRGRGGFIPRPTGKVTPIYQPAMPTTAAPVVTTAVATGPSSSTPARKPSSSASTRVSQSQAPTASTVRLAPPPPRHRYVGESEHSSEEETGLSEVGETGGKKKVDRNQSRKVNPYLLSSLHNLISYYLFPFRAVVKNVAKLKLLRSRKLSSTRTL